MIFMRQASVIIVHYEAVYGEHSRGLVLCFKWGWGRRGVVVEEGGVQQLVLTVISNHTP